MSSPFQLTDTRNAERFVKEYGRDVRFVPHLGGFLVFNGTHWAVDGLGEVQELMKSVIRLQMRDAVAIADDVERRRAIKEVLRHEYVQRIKGALTLAQSADGIAARASDFDSDPDILNVMNGTIDLRTGKFREEHQREDLITKLAPVAFDPKAKAPMWNGFLERVLPNEELRAFVQRAVGLSLTGEAGEHVLFLCHGKGRNGKSTLFEVVRAMLGDYALAAPSELILHRDRGRGGATPDRADLQGRRFVTTIETGQGRRLDEPLIKGGPNVSVG